MTGAGPWRSPGGSPIGWPQLTAPDRGFTCAPLADPLVNEAEKDPARIAAMFDAIAGRYDLLNRLLSFGLDSRWRAEAVRAADLRPGDTVVDLCAGTCDLAIAAVSGSHGLARVMAIDFAAGMLRRGLAKVRRRSLPVPISVVRGDA